MYAHSKPKDLLFSETKTLTSAISEQMENGEEHHEKSDKLFFHEETDVVRVKPVCSIDPQLSLVSGYIQSYLLVINLVKIQFDDHPLLCEEIALAKTLVELTKTIQERRRVNAFEYLSLKLEALRGAYEEFIRTSPFSNLLARSAEPDSAVKDIRPKRTRAKSVLLTKLHEQDQREKMRVSLLKDEMKRLSYLEDICATRMLRDTEGQTDRILEYRAIKTWDAIKKLRASNGFSSTRISLKIRVDDREPEVAEETLQREMGNELQEQEELHNIRIAREKRTYERELEKWNAKKAELERKEQDQQDGSNRVEKSSNLSLDQGDLALQSPTLSKSANGYDSSKSAEEDEISRIASLRKLSKKKKKKHQTSAESREESQKEKLLAIIPAEPKPKAFQHKKIASQIKKRLQLSRRPIGEPNLTFILENSHHITETAACPRMEQLRRYQLDATFVYLRFLYNDKEVTRTVARPIDPATFTFNFNGIQDLAEAQNLIKGARSNHNHNHISKTAFGVRVFETPRSLKVEVYEAGVFGDVCLGEVFVSIPASTEQSLALNREISRLKFTGKPYSAQTSNENGISFTEKWTSGEIEMTAAWAVDEHGKSLGPPKESQLATRRRTLDPINYNGPPGLLNLPKLMQWVVDMRIDPNDPRNNEILMLKSTVQSVSKLLSATASSVYDYWNTRAVFRLGLPQWLHDVTIGIEADATKSKRVKMLKERFANNLLKPGFQVPLEENEITYDVQTLFNKMVEDQHPIISGNAKLSATNGSKYSVGFLKRVRELQILRRTRLVRPVHVDDLVKEERLIQIIDDSSPFDFLFRINRPLRPHRTDRKANAVMSPESCRIIIQVLQGFNLPVRKNALKVASSTDKQGTTIYVQPFVEASFQQRKARSRTADGPNPQWNETISLDISMPNNDLRPDALYNSEIGLENLFINLFDETIVDLIRDNRDRETNIHQRIDRSWLGSLQIPFSTLWEQLRIDGSYLMDLPPQSLGYEKKILENAQVTGEVGADTLLRLFITLDPPLMQPPQLKLMFQSDEDPKLVRYAQDWLSSTSHLKRVGIATVEDICGKTTLINRFVSPMDPPSRIQSTEQIIRYVSMIPFIPNRASFGVDCKLISNMKEILELGAANDIEHAIILCNYMLSQDLNAYVVLGRGIPEGTTAYVLLRNMAGSLRNRPDNAVKLATGLDDASPGTARNSNAQSTVLINPVTGKAYDLTDANIPMKEVGCIFNSGNIWMNIQMDPAAHKIHFRLSDQKAWKPFFTSSFPMPDLKTVQPERVIYQDADAKSMTELEQTLERAIISNIEEWRQDRVTRWNRMCSRTFKSLMSRFELESISGVSIASTLETSQELASIGNVYKLNGFPLNAPFTDISSACALVFNTAVHVNQSPGTEFALAVQCHAYPGGFISMWIYVASLMRQT